MPLFAPILDGDEANALPRLNKEFIMMSKTVIITGIALLFCLLLAGCKDSTPSGGQVPVNPNQGGDVIMVPADPPGE
jgi:hypothetical protein